MVDVNILNADILREPSDLMILKHADAFHGVDGVVSGIIGFDRQVPFNHHVFRPGIGLASKAVLFVGVGPLQDFRYERIREFATRALSLAATHDAKIRTIASPVHGFGYGLDVGEAFRSLIAGFYDAIDQNAHPRGLRTIVVVERDAKRAHRFRELLKSFTGNARGHAEEDARSPTTPPRMENVGAKSEQKKRLIVAMPFGEAHEDVWEIAIQEACAAAGMLCEHMGKEAFAGDVMAEIKVRIQKGCGLIGVLNDANPNVFLEIGYAWGLGKPTVLITNDIENLPYDVKGQKCIKYKQIHKLREQLTEELMRLLAAGVFDGADSRTS